MHDASPSFQRPAPVVMCGPQLGGPAEGAGTGGGGGAAASPSSPSTAEGASKQQDTAARTTHGMAAMSGDEQHLMASLDFDDPNHLALLALRMGRGSSVNGVARASGEARGGASAVLAARSSSNWYTEGQPAHEADLRGGPRGRLQGGGQQQHQQRQDDEQAEQLMVAMFGPAHPHRLHQSSRGALSTGQQS